MVALKLFDSVPHQFFIGVSDGARMVPEIDEPALPSGIFLDRVQVADLDGNLHIQLGNSKHALLGRLRDLCFYLSFSVCCQLLHLPLYVQFAGRVGNWFVIKIFQRDP
jgi:hypothetical protein